MNNFFSHEVGWTIYQRYGWFHFLQIFITLIIILIIYFSREKLKNNKLNNKFIRVFMASFLLYNMLIYYFSQIITGYWSLERGLPLHLCFIANFLFIYVLYTNNKRNWFKWVYFLTFAGPLPYIIFPDIAVNGVSKLFGPDRFLFYQAFFSHFFLIVCSCYCIFVYGWKINRKDIHNAFFISNLIFLIVFLFNLIFGTNYIMTKSLPNYIFDIIPFLKYINYPILILEIAGTLSMFIAYIPPMLINGKKIRNI